MTGFSTNWTWHKTLWFEEKTKENWIFLGGGGGALILIPAATAPFHGVESDQKMPSCDQADTQTHTHCVCVCVNGC